MKLLAVVGTISALLWWGGRFWHYPAPHTNQGEKPAAPYG